MLNFAPLSALVLAASLSLGTPVLTAADAARTTETSSNRSTFVVHHGVQVKLDVDAGDVQIRTWMFDKVAVSSSSMPDGITRTFEQQGNTVMVHVKQDDALHPVSGQGLVHTIYVPASAHVEAFVSNGKADIDGVYGSVAVHAEGDVRLHDVSRIVESSSATGRVFEVIHTTDGELVEQPISADSN
jgi:hypothetical protein